MAGSARSAAAKHAYRMFTPSRSAAARGSPGSADEFDESDVWGSFGPAELVRPRTITSSSRASGRKKPLDHAGAVSDPSRSAAARGSPGSAADEFDESDVWGSFGPAELVRPRTITSSSRASGRKKPLDHAGAVSGSLPMSIPDWQKILGVEYRDHHAGEWELDGDDDDYGKVGAGCRSGSVIPPHELAWRSGAASLSVHEGIGRTLKGRDLSRVRDAVWKRTGFVD